jgi:hypothetical protein
MILRQVGEKLWEMPQPPGLYAGDLFQRGTDYLSAFEQLAENGDARHRHAVYYLLTHSMELLLKAFLVARGVPKADLGNKKKGLSHNLAEVFTECERREIPSVDKLRPLSNQLAEMNSDHDFRYPTGFNLSVPRPSECLPVMHALVSAIRPIIVMASEDAQLRYGEMTRHLRGSKIRWSD